MSLAVADPLGFWEVISLWGPALPLLVIVLMFLDRVAKRYIERGFRDNRDALHKTELHNAECHEEHMAVLREIHDAVCDGDPPRRRRRRDRPDDEP